MNNFKILFYSLSAFLALFIVIGIYYGIMIFFALIKLISLAVIIGYGFYLFGKLNKRKD